MRFSIVALTSALLAASPATANTAFSGSGLLLTVPVGTNSKLPSSANSIGCLDASGGLVKNGTTTSDGCGTYTTMHSGQAFQNGNSQPLGLDQSLPYPLSVGSGIQAFHIMAFSKNPGYVFYGDLSTNWFTFPNGTGDIRLNSLPGDITVALYFSQ